MTKQKNEKRVIPKRNYFIAGFILIAIIGLLLYALKWYQVKETELYRETYLIKTNTLTLETKDKNELHNILIESPDKYFVFIGYINNKDEYLLEKRIKPLIDQYNLNDIVYYFNASEIVNEDNYLETLNSMFNFDDKKLTKVPAIIYYNKDTYKIIDTNIKTQLENLLLNEEFEKTAN